MLTSEKKENIGKVAPVKKTGVKKNLEKFWL
jgi:hypothetical protein